MLFLSKFARHFQPPLEFLYAVTNQLSLGLMYETELIFFNLFFIFIFSPYR